MSERYPGGFITKTPPTLNPALGNSTPGVWTLDQVMQNIKAGTWPAYDPYFEYTTLLLHGNGTNGAQNNTFLDSSSNNFTITRNGNTTQGAFTPYQQNGYWSNYFNGTDAYLITGTSSNLTLANNADWTVEAWIFLSASTYQQILFNSGGGSDSWSTQHNCDFAVNSSGFLSFEYSASGTPTSVAGTTATTRNAWNHIAWVFNGTSKTLTTYVNGVRDLNATSVSGYTPPNATPRITIGRTDPTVPNPYQWWVTGYISNVRVVRGSQVYSGATITVPTGPLTAITNTSLLTCQSNRFVDNSSNAFAITANGSPSVQRFSPFSPSAAYAAGTIGGSGYFDGSGDYLSISSGSTALPTGTQDYSVEAWVYWGTQATSYPQIIANPTNDGFQIYYDVANTLLAVGRYNVANVITYTVAQSVLANRWTHIVATRSGNTHRLFVDGVLQANGSNSISFAGLTTQSVGSSGAANYLVGYMSDVRTVLGSIPTTYQTSSTTNGTSVFTPPTAPVTTSSQGSSAPALLLNFTNGGIIDNAMMNDLETVGNAQISTTQSKFGGASLSFDGTGDYLVAPSNSVFSFGTGDFTIECWYYSGATGQQTVFDTRNTSSGPGVLVYTLSNKLRVYSNGVDYIGTANVASNTWVHLVVERRSSALYTYVNGTVDINGTSYTPNLTDSSCIVGYDIRYGGFYLNGYIDDLRITKGYARYTGNVTPQTSQWQDQ